MWLNPVMCLLNWRKGFGNPNCSSKTEFEKAQIASVQSRQADPNQTLALRLKDIDIEAAQLQLTSLQAQLDKTRLVAATSGVVTFVTDAQQGSVVDAYNTLVVLSDPEHLELSYEATDIGTLTGIEVGMNVEVKLAKSGSTVQGKVLRTPSSSPQQITRHKPKEMPKRLLLGFL